MNWLWSRIPGLLIGTLGLCLACATSGSGESSGDNKDLEGIGRIDQSRGESTVTVTYATTAKANWIRGEEEYLDESFLTAHKYYAYIRAKFPYSAFASRAELRIADCLFERKRFVEAVDAYQNFVRLHSTHPKVAYASLMIAKSYFEQIPDDWFLLPPSHEKDQSSVRRAAVALGDYVSRYPSDASIKEGKKLLANVRTRLMDHERYVADFYRNLGQNRAYVGRLQTIKNEYSDVGLNDELLLEMIEVYATLGDHDGALKIETEFAKQFAASSLLPRAREVLAGIPKKTAVPKKESTKPTKSVSE